MKDPLRMRALGELPIEQTRQNPFRLMTNFLDVFQLYFNSKHNDGVTSLWSIYSMLNSKFVSLYGVTMKDEFPRLMVQIKRQTGDHVPEKASTFVCSNFISYYTFIY